MIAGNRAGSFERVCRELDDRKGPERAHDPPGGNRASRLQNAPVACHEQQIDREPHAERMHHVRRRNDESLLGMEHRAAEQTAVSGGRIERPLQPGGEDAGSRVVSKRKGPGTGPQKRLKKVLSQARLRERPEE